MYDPEFARMAAETGNAAGWIKEDGQFVNASSLVNDEVSFGAKDRFATRPSFDDQGNFWFILVDEPNATVQLYRMAPDDERPVIVEAGPIPSTGVPDYVHTPSGPAYLDLLTFFQPTLRKGVGCHEPNDFTVRGRCVQVVDSGRFHSVHHIAILDPYQELNTIIQGIDRWGEMFAIRGVQITPKSTLEVRYPVFSPDGSRIAFSVYDYTEGVLLYEGNISASEPRLIGVSTKPAVDLRHWALIGWL